MQTYWVSQSPVTDPGPAAAAIDALPGDPAALREASSQLVFHFQTGGDFAENGVPAGRMAEISTRYADAMFALLLDRGEPALMRDRPAADRVVGCCRDATVLFLALARHKGIPARARVGFAAYIVPGWLIDHVVAEAWDDAEGRWRLIDPQMDSGRTPEVNGRPVSRPGHMQRQLNLARSRSLRSSRHDGKRRAYAPRRGGRAPSSMRTIIRWTPDQQACRAPSLVTALQRATSPGKQHKQVVFPAQQLYLQMLSYSMVQTITIHFVDLAIRQPRYSQPARGQTLPRTDIATLDQPRAGGAPQQYRWRRSHHRCTVRGARFARRARM
jgi:hypothetical protein